jgi:hypothetical protein
MDRINYNVKAGWRFGGKRKWIKLTN